MKMPIRLLLLPPILLGGFAPSGCASAGQPMMGMKPGYARRQPAGGVSMFKPAVAVAAAEPATPAAPSPAAAAETAPEPQAEPAEAPQPPRLLTRADKNEIDDQVMP